MTTIRQQRDRELVSATNLENIYAGIGAGALALCGQLIWRMEAQLPLLTAPVGIWSLIASLSLFGVLSVIRFSLDEWRDSMERAKMYALLADKEATIDRQAATVNEQQAEITRLRSRIRGQEFKAAAKDARNIVTPDETNTDKRVRNAERILDRWANNQPYGREVVSMSRQDWEAAMGLLQSAGVVGRGGAGGRQWVVTARNHGEALHALRARGRVWNASEGTTFVAA